MAPSSERGTSTARSEAINVCQFGSRASVGNWMPTTPWTFSIAPLPSSKTTTTVPSVRNTSAVWTTAARMISSGSSDCPT